MGGPAHAKVEPNACAYVFCGGLDPWSEIKKIDDVEASFAEFWHLLVRCFQSLRAGSVEFISSHLSPFVLLLKEAEPFCPDHHLAHMSGFIEEVDLLCNALSHTRANKARRMLFRLLDALNVTKSETMDGLMQEVSEQKVLILKLEQTVAQQQLVIESQQALIASRSQSHTVLPAASAVSSSPSSPSKGPRASQQSRGQHCSGGCGKLLRKADHSATAWRKIAQQGFMCTVCTALLLPVSSSGPGSASKAATASARSLPSVLPSPSSVCALTLSVSGQEPTPVSLKTQSPSILTTVSSPCVPFGSPEHSFTSQQPNVLCAGDGISTEGQKRVSVGVDSACSNEVEAGFAGEVGAFVDAA